MNYDFCADLDAPELLVIINSKWFRDNKKELEEFLRPYGNYPMYNIMAPKMRTYFMLRWPQ